MINAIVDTQVCIHHDLCRWFERAEREASNLKAEVSSSADAQQMVQVEMQSKARELQVRACPHAVHHVSMCAHVHMLHIAFGACVFVRSCL